MTPIGVAIVTYNSEGEIGRAIDAIPPGVEIVVVDNASGDGTRAEVLRRPRARLIANPWNRGFAAAANQGISALDCRCVLLLNPDVELLGGADSLEALSAHCEQPGVVAASGKLLDNNGRPQTGFMVRGFPTPAALALEVMGLNRIWRGNAVNRRYRCLDMPLDVAADVEQPAGAFLMIRKEAWRNLGGFDERFRPVWFEDVDLLKRAAAAGYVARYVPSATAKHKGGHSVGRLRAADREFYWYDNLLRYAARHFSRGGRRAVCAALILGSSLRASLAVVRWRSLKPVLIYARICRLAGGHLYSSRPQGLFVSSPVPVRPGGVMYGTF